MQESSRQMSAPHRSSGTCSIRLRVAQTKKPLSFIIFCSFSNIFLHLSKHSNPVWRIPQQYGLVRKWWSWIIWFYPLHANQDSFSFLNFFIIARFQLQNVYPTLILIMAGGNDIRTYLGPTDLGSLVEFVNIETARPEKVRTHKIRKV